MLNFGDLLNLEGLEFRKVRLLRHQDNRHKSFRTSYAVWRDDRPAFEEYQRTQSFSDCSKLTGDIWASFVGLPNNETMFVGLYSSTFLGATPSDRIHPITRSVIPAGSCNHYELGLLPQMSEMKGRLLIDWGPGFRAWVQRADSKPKRVTEYRKQFMEPDFPGFSCFLSKLSDINSLPVSWLSALRSTRGIYVLTCPKTKEQYVGSASGAGGFLSRWYEYSVTGHGGNIALKGREASDYQIGILQTVGSDANEIEILTLETLWKKKLQSREMGLNRN